MRALDVYSGIGGWTCGLRLAGVDVVGSYEWWPAAVETNNANNGSHFAPVNVRTMDLASLPANVDLVVGSPPYTQFSYANRGGDGDLDEGLKDVTRFLEIVRVLEPRFWAMENVPRLAKILADGFRNPAHLLYSYRDLSPEIAVLDFSHYGAPQVRKRCIAGNIPFEALTRYSNRVPSVSLGHVVGSLAAQDEITDPIWGVRLSEGEVSERATETPLTQEELRLNREAKQHHPVYNDMAFPDPLDVGSRTVTATCTRVSRESIIIFDPRLGSYRRLSIRERACLQAFPITYQFYAPSYSQKVKMIGNAVPPSFSYLLGMAVQGFREFVGFTTAPGALALPPKQGPQTKPDRPSGKYRDSRRFRAAIPGLRFKSGVRFELCNDFSGDGVEWRCKFVHGTPKDIRELQLDGTATAQLKGSALLAPIRDALSEELVKAEEQLRWLTPENLQAAWTRRMNGIGPFEVVDLLAETAQRVMHRMKQLPPEQIEGCVLRIVGGPAASSNLTPPPRSSKLRNNAIGIASGILVGDWFNRRLRSAVAKSAA